MALAPATDLRPLQAAGPLRPSIGRWCLALNVAALLAVAVFLRAWHLDRVPGLNGDEAWSGVQAVRLAHGEPIAWRTPTGNPINPFFLLPLALLHVVLPPSVTLLRSVALVSGLSALVVNWLLCQRTFGARAAWISTTVLAVLPLDIAYSRFAWDASQSLLATLLVLYLGLEFCLRRRNQAARPVPVLLACGVAVLVHPTNLFALWLVLIPAGWSYRNEVSHCCGRLRNSRWRVCAAGAGVILGATICWPMRHLLATAAARAIDPAQWGLFVRLLVRLFSGSTVYTFIAGPANDSSALETGDCALLALLLVATGGVIQRIRSGSQADRLLAASYAAMLVSFFLFAGPNALAPHFERYAVCLIAPGAVLLARGCEYWLDTRGRLRPVIAVALGCVAWVGLAQFQSRYFQVIEQTGGLSHRAFRTAAVEPKLNAWRQIRSDAGAMPVSIVADDWWAYWPLKYFAAEDPSAQVLTWDEFLARSDSPATFGQVVFVSLRGVPQDGRVAAYLAAHASGNRTNVINDFAGQPVLDWVAVATD